jgi:hypothetical protein
MDSTSASRGSEEMEDDVVEEKGHVADLAAIFQPPGRINQSVNKYFML